MVPGLGENLDVVGLEQPGYTGLARQFLIAAVGADFKICVIFL